MNKQEAIDLIWDYLSTKDEAAPGVREVSVTGDDETGWSVTFRLPRRGGGNEYAEGFGPDLLTAMAEAVKSWDSENWWRRRDGLKPWLPSEAS